MSDSEVWKDIVGYEGLYKVSDKGNIYSVERISSQGNKWGGITLKPRYDKHGYFRVTLYKNGKQKTRFIHRLVAEAFIPNPNGYSEINHRDENKINNYAENLEWCTIKQNNNHGTRTERASQTKCKKVRAINVETGEILTFNSAKEAHSKGYPSASEACRGVYNAGGGNLYKGHKWYYEIMEGEK